MKMRVLLAIWFMPMVYGSAVAGNGALKTDQQKSSYAIGLQIVQNLLRREEFKIDKEALLLGITDTLLDHAPRLSRAEVKAANEWQQNEINKQRHAKAERNLAAGKAFLEQNKRKEGVKTLASGLQYQVLKEGTGPRPDASDTVTVHYRGALIDGKEFAATESKPAHLPIMKLIKGWQEALLLMSEGAKWQIFIPPDLAYGEEGSLNGKIAPNETLVFDMELLSIGKSAGSKRAGSEPAAESSTK